MIAFFASYNLFLSLLIVLILAFFFSTILFKVSFWQFCGWPQSIFFASFLFLNRLSGFIMEIKARRWYRALLSLWLIIIILGFLINYLYRYDFVMNGNHAGVIASSFIDEGPLSKLGDFSFRLEDNRIKLSLGKRVFNLSVGRGTYYGLNYILYIKRGLSPRFLLKDKEGRELDTAFVMLEPGKEDYFKSPALPHRFYVKKDKEGFALRIMRGKLTLKRGIIKIGQEMEFEELRISFPEVTEWYQIRIINYPGNRFIFFCSIILIAFAVALRLKGRKSQDG